MRRPFSKGRLKTTPNRRESRESFESQVAIVQKAANEMRPLEERASASEELSAQSDTLRAIVGRLRHGGRRSGFWRWRRRSGKKPVGIKGTCRGGALAAGEGF